MAITFPCSHCGQMLSVADEHIGKQARCPGCDFINKVPTSSVTPTANSFSNSNLAKPSEPETLTPIQGANSSGMVDLGRSPASGTFNAGAGANADSGEYYLKAANGEIYGPINWSTLLTWQRENRIGPNYQIREGLNGSWQPVTSSKLFTASANPYADTMYQPAAAGNYTNAYPRADRSGLVLTLGILSWGLLFVCGPFGTICGIIAWVIGSQEMKAMQQGLLDPRTKGQIQAGFYLGMAQVICSVLCFGAYICFVIFAVAMDVNNR